MATIDLQLAGLTCGACVKLATRALNQIEGITQIDMDPTGKTKIVSTREIEKDEIIQALQDTDYTLAN